jgi:hypothetical protein
MVRDSRIGNAGAPRPVIDDHLGDLHADLARMAGRKRASRRKRSGFTTSARNTFNEQP